jgi:hypothetical protein
MLDEGGASENCPGQSRGLHPVSNSREPLVKVNFSQTLSISSLAIDVGKSKGTVREEVGSMR